VRKHGAQNPAYRLTSHFISLISNWRDDAECHRRNPGFAGFLLSGFCFCHLCTLSVAKFFDRVPGLILIISVMPFSSLVQNEWLLKSFSLHLIGF